MKKILVTGGAGFIGSHTVVELAQAGYIPVMVDDFSNSDDRVLEGLQSVLGYLPPLYRVDVCDEAALRSVFQQEQPFGVIHFAAFKAVGESVADPVKYYQNNLGSLLALLKVMKEFGVQSLVFSSSCTVYGQPEVNPVTEYTTFMPAESPYGASKQMGERIIADYHRAHENFGAVLLRYFNPIGAHESGKIGELPYGVPNNLIPYITQTAAGIREKLLVFGNDYNTPDGSCIRDFIHVGDLAKAHVKALEWLLASAHGFEIFNLGQGKGHSVLEVVKTFEKVSGQPLNYVITDRRTGDVEQIWADVSKANEMLNWETAYSLEDALRHAWKWQQQLLETHQ